MSNPEAPVVAENRTLLLPEDTAHLTFLTTFGQNSITGSEAVVEFSLLYFSGVCNAVFLSLLSRFMCILHSTC